MEDRKLNEKESLELITQMIRNTRWNLDAGSGNMFFIVGVCLCVADSGCLGRGRSDAKFCMDVGLLGNSRCGLPAELHFYAEKGQAGEFVYR